VQKDIQVTSVFFWLLQFACKKAASKTMVKSTPGLNFINILCTAFEPADPESVKRY